KVLDSKDRDKCVKTIGKNGQKYALGILKTIQKCLASQIKDGAAGNLVPVCVGQWSGGSLTAPTDGKTAYSLAGQLEKALAGIDKSCGTLIPDFLKSIYACPGATTVDDL